MSFVDRVGFAANVAGQNMEKLLTKEFYKFAVSMGWPEEIASKCEVFYDSTEFCVAPSNDEDYEAVLDWELGTPERPGLPAMLKFMNKIDNYSEEWAEALFQSLDENGVL